MSSRIYKVQQTIGKVLQNAQKVTQHCIGCKAIKRVIKKVLNK